MIGNDDMWPEVTGIDPEETSFDRKSPGSGCKMPINQNWVRLSSCRAVTRVRGHSRERK